MFISFIYIFLTGQNYLFIIALVHKFYMQNTLLIAEKLKNTNKKEKENYCNPHCWHLRDVYMWMCLNTSFLQICNILCMFFVYTFY